MDLENKIVELENKIDANMNKIINNMNELHSCEEKINDNSEKIKANSLIIDILKDYKKEVRILQKVLGFAFIVILALLGILFFK